LTKELIMKRINLLVLASFFVLGTACGGKETPVESPQPVTEEEAAPTPVDVQASCEGMFAKARECTDDYLPALVDLRIKLDMPAGIAQAAQTEGRAALIDAARAEWATDSLPENAATVCQNIAANMGGEQGAEVAEDTNECVAMDSCSRFVGCIIPLQEDLFRGASHKEMTAMGD
jgi:hypothetical protein